MQLYVAGANNVRNSHIYKQMHHFFELWECGEILCTLFSCRTNFDIMGGLITNSMQHIAS
jgi:hypothetical protein